MSRVFCKPGSKVSKERYGFKSTNVPPAVTPTAEDRLDFLNMIKTLEFRRVNNLFQDHLNSGIRQIKNNHNIFVPAYKSRNTYMSLQVEYTK